MKKQQQLVGFSLRYCEYMFEMIRALLRSEFIFIFGSVDRGTPTRPRCAESFGLSSIFLFIFAAPWLTGQIVAMECGVGQKERRTRNSVTSWRGLTLFPRSPLTLFVSYSLSSAIQSLFSLQAFLAFSPSLTHSFTLSGCCTLMWCWPRYSRLASFLTHTHTHSQHRYILRLEQHRHKIPRAQHTHMRSNRNVWEYPLWLPL